MLCLQEIKVAKENCPEECIFEGYTTIFNLLSEEQIKNKWVERKETKGITPLQCERALEAGKKLNASEGMTTIIANKWSSHIDLIDMNSLKSGARSCKRIQISVIRLLEDTVYAPCGGSERLDDFLEDMESMLKEAREKYEGWNITTIRMGDFNAITGNRDIRRSSSDTDQSSQTCNIDEYMNSHKLACGVRGFKGRKAKIFTWTRAELSEGSRKAFRIEEKIDNQVVSNQVFTIIMGSYIL